MTTKIIKFRKETPYTRMRETAPLLQDGLEITAIFRGLAAWRMRGALHRAGCAVFNLCAVLILQFLLYSTVAFADSKLPDIDPKFATVTVQNPTRDAGYVVGDVLDRTVTIYIKKPYELVMESLPIVGYEHRWKGQISGVELVKIATETSADAHSATHRLQLRYQVFTTGRTVKHASLRAELLKVRNTQTKEVMQLRVPFYDFRVSPLSIFGQVKLREELSPFRPPLLLNNNQALIYLKICLIVLGLSLLGLLYILGLRAWLPKMGAPFAKAYRDIRKMPDTPEGLQQAVARVHEAINNTVDIKIFNHNVDYFLHKKPAFSMIHQEITQFFALSRQVFFEPTLPLELGAPAKTWLLKFCRHMRDCERGLTPDVVQKAAS